MSNSIDPSLNRGKPLQDQVNTSHLVHSLASGTCPACGGRKRFKNSFCSSCYGQLPRNMKRALYNLISEGYEQAFVEAAERLHVRTLIWPMSEGW